MEQCCLCQTDISGGVATTEFPCHHKCHTECIFRRAVNIGFGITCDTCNTLIVPMEVFNDIIGHGRGDDDEVDKNEIAKIHNELSKNKALKQDAKLFKKTVRELRSARFAFKTKMTATKRAFNQEIDGFMRGIMEIRKRYITTAKQLDEYKQLILKQRRVSYYMNRLSKKWNISELNFYKSLIKRGNYWNTRHLLCGAAPYLVRKAMRLRWRY